MTFDFALIVHSISLFWNYKVLSDLFFKLNVPGPPSVHYIKIYQSKNSFKSPLFVFGAALLARNV